MKTIEKDFNKSVHQNFDSIKRSLAELFQRVAIASANNDYQNLLNSNIWGKYYHKLTAQELFLMHLNDKEILAILNQSIYNSITHDDYQHLINGIFTYSRLRLLNRTHLSGPKNWIAIESMITNDEELKNAIYTKTSSFNNDKTYDPVVLLSGNLLKTILVRPDFKSQVVKQYSELIDGIPSKFDNAFISYLYGLANDDYELCKSSFEAMEQLYGRCQWLTSGWYKEANLNKKLPVFLLSLYQLKNFSTANFNLEIKNEFLKAASRFIIDNPNYKPKISVQFNGELTFLNEILTNDFTPFYKNYKIKLNEIKQQTKV